MKINQGEVPQYYVENNHEAIIDPQPFDMVQAELARRTEGNNRHSGVTSFHTKSSAVTAADGTVPRYGTQTISSEGSSGNVTTSTKNKDKHCTTPYLDENQIKERFSIAVNKLLAGSSSAIRACEESLSTALDTSELEQKQQSLLTEMQTHDSALRQLIHRNATTARDQNEYRKSYDAIAQKFSPAEEQKKLVDKKLSDLLKHRCIIENFIKKLKEQNGQISEFRENLWCGLLDYVTAYTDGRLVFRFKMVLNLNGKRKIPIINNGGREFVLGNITCIALENTLFQITTGTYLSLSARIVVNRKTFEIQPIIF